MRSPQEYRNRAARLRLDGDICPNAEIRRQIMRIADLYERLADNVERITASDPARHQEAHSRAGVSN